PENQAVAAIRIAESVASVDDRSAVAGPRRMTACAAVCLVRLAWPSVAVTSMAVPWGRLWCQRGGDGGPTGGLGGWGQPRVGRGVAFALRGAGWLACLTARSSAAGRTGHLPGHGRAGRGRACHRQRRVAECAGPGWLDGAIGFWASGLWRPGRGR